MNIGSSEKFPSQVNLPSRRFGANSAPAVNTPLIIKRVIVNGKTDKLILQSALIQPLNAYQQLSIPAGTPGFGYLQPANYANVVNRYTANQFRNTSIDSAIPDNDEVFPRLKIRAFLIKIRSYSDMLVSEDYCQKSYVIVSPSFDPTTLGSYQANRDCWKHFSSYDVLTPNVQDADIPQKNTWFIEMLTTPEKLKLDHLDEMCMPQVSQDVYFGPTPVGGARVHYWGWFFIAILATDSVTDEEIKKAYDAGSLFSNM